MAIKLLSHAVIIFNLKRRKEIPWEELHETLSVQVPENIVFFSGDEIAKKYGSLQRIYSSLFIDAMTPTLELLI